MLFFSSLDLLLFDLVGYFGPSADFIRVEGGIIDIVVVVVPIVVVVVIIAHIFFFGTAFFRSLGSKLLLWGLFWARIVVVVAVRAIIIIDIIIIGGIHGIGNEIVEDVFTVITVVVRFSGVGCHGVCVCGYRVCYCFISDVPR